MTAWITLLSWIVKLSTWKTLIFWIFGKPEVEKEEKVNQESGSPSSCEPDGKDVATAARQSLQNLLSAISIEKHLTVKFGGGSSFKYYTGDEGKTLFPIRTGLHHDAWNQIASAIASSCTLTSVSLILGLEVVEEVLLEMEAGERVRLVEEFGAALISNQRMEIVKIDTYACPLEPILAKLSEVLLESPLMTTLGLCSYLHGVVGATTIEKFASALHKHPTLQLLSVENGGWGGKGLGVLLGPFMGGEGSNQVMTTLNLWRAGIDNKVAELIAHMICCNTSLNDLDLFKNEIGAEGAIHISKALHCNSTLRSLDVRFNPIGAVGLKALVAALTPNAEGIQANTSLTDLIIFGCDVEDEGIGYLEALVRNNNTLSTLNVGHQSILQDAKNVIKLFESLKGNKSLKRIVLFGSQGVAGRKVLGTILDMLQVNHHIEEVDITYTPLEDDGGANIVRAQLELRKHDKVWAVLNGMATVLPNSARVFLCGYPYAGKTTLRKSMMRKMNITPKPESRRKYIPNLRPKFRSGKSNARMSSHRDLEERTRGIEVHSMSCDDMLITMWNMAGHDDYHSFHDLVVPNLGGGGSSCSFLLVCNLLHLVNFQAKKLKSPEEIEEELLYWLRFIASNTRISASYRSHVTVVFTNRECPDFLTSESIRLPMIDDKIDKLRTQFEDLLEIDAERFLVDARCDEATLPLFNSMKVHLKHLLGRLPMVFEACVKMQAIIARWNQEHPKEPLLRWNAFADMCDEVEELRGDGVDPEVVKTKKEVVATSLHDGGQLIYYKGLDFVVLNPNWFCHDIIGHVIKCKELDAIDGISNGMITKRDFKNVVIASFENKLQGFSFEDLLQMMMKLELCYEQDDEIFMPAILRDDNDLSPLGKRQLKWPSKESQRHYVGRRLMCSDGARTMLTLGFFPRLQVHFQREYGSNDGESTYKLDKNMISFIHRGMEVIVENGGQSGFDIDILVRSSIASEDMILEFVCEDVMNTIYNLCVHPTLGCQGVKLEEGIIRPECVKNLVPHVQRRHQVVLVEDLKRIVLASGDLNYVHNWRADGRTLDRGYDEVKTLLGKKAWENLLNRHLKDLHNIQILNSLQDGGKSIAHCELSESEDGEPSSIQDLHKLVKKDIHRLYRKVEECEANILKNMREMEDRITKKLDKILLLQEVLLPTLCAKFDELMTYSVELQQSEVPRFVCFSAGKDNFFKKLVTKWVPGLKNLHLHLMCEHKDGFHIVKDQKGCPVWFGNAETMVCQTLMVGGLRVIVLLAKVGAHLAAGMGNMVPDLPKDFMLVLDTPGFLDTWKLPQAVRTSDGKVELVDEMVTPTAREIADRWLVKFLRSKDLGELFGLQKVVYSVSGEGRGSVAWVCEEHVREGEENQSLKVLCN